MLKELCYVRCQRITNTIEFHLYIESKQTAKYAKIKQNKQKTFIDTQNKRDCQRG